MSASRVPSFGLAGGTGARGLHTLVVNQIGQMIASGELAENDQISPESVGEQLGASRTVVREALRVLEAKGMVRPRPKIGTRVLPVTEWDLLDTDVIGWRVRGPDRVAQLSELMDLRVAVEISAAGACCSHATPAEIDAMYADVDLMHASAVDGDLHQFTEADIGFHAKLLTASGNLVFTRFVEPFAAVLQAREELKFLPSQVSDGVIELHRAIVDAIAANDSPTAQRHARAMIDDARMELFDHLGVSSEVVHTRRHHV